MLNRSANFRLGLSWHHLPRVRGLRLAGALLLLAIAGCRPAPQGVQGTVTLDGQPLDEAAIHFVPVGQPGRKTGCEIRQGAFELPAADGLLPGKYRVEILDIPPLHTAHAPAGAPKRRPFPHRYSHASPLHIAILPNRSSDDPPLKFELKN